MNTEGKPQVVVFDLDGTITKRDTVVPFILRCRRAPNLITRLIKVCVLRPNWLLLRRRDLIKEHVVAAALSDLSAEAVREYSKQHCDWVLSRLIRSECINLIETHQRRGDEVVLVTASFENYAALIGQKLGIAAVIATKLEQENGDLTGRLDGPNCRGSEKVRRLLEWNPELELRRPLFAYGDSTSDLPLLWFAQYGLRLRSRFGRHKFVLVT